MLLVPYKAELEHLRIPFITIFVMIVCIVVLHMQVSSAERTEQYIQNFCHEHNDITFRINMKKLTGVSESYACESLIYARMFDVNANSKFDDLIYESEQVSGYSPLESQVYLREFFEERFASFDQLNVSDMTDSMAYYPNELNVFKMFKATLAHAD